MKWAHSTHGKDEKCIQSSSENLKARLKCRLKDTKINITEQDSNGVDLTDLAHDHKQVLPLGSIKFREFLD